MINILIAFYSFWVVAFWLIALFFEYRPEIHFNIPEFLSVSVFIAASLLLCILWPIILVTLGVLALIHTLTRKGDKK